MDELGPRVPPVGPKSARLMIVGESPGRQEILAGRPFVGPAGQLLDRFLQAAGLSRDDIYITNVVKYLPPGGDKKDEFFFNTVWRTKTIAESRTPTQVYIFGIIEVINEIREVQPNVIVALGNYALWGLTQKWGIFDWRGSIIQTAFDPKTKVVPTIHPAWYLYGEDGKAQGHKKLLGNWDFIRAAHHSRFPELRMPERNFNISPTPSEIEDTIARFTDPSLEYLGVDTEWYSPDSLAYIAFGVGSSDIVCIAPDSMLAFRAYKALLGSDVPKVWQNAMFDAAALYRMGIEVRNVAHDTMLEWHFNWGSVIEQKGLDVICSVLTEQPYYKSDVEFVGLKDDRGKEYACTDVAVMNEAHEKMQAEEFEITGTRRGYEISMSIMNTMIKAAQTGILADMDKLLALRKEKLEKAKERNAALCTKLGISALNVRSWQQVQRVVYDDLGFGKRFTARSTDQKVLMEIAATLFAEDPESEEVQILIDIIRERQDLNICSRYLNEGIVDKDGRIKTNWNLAGTKNGRLSSTIPWWNGVALQTMPEEAREVCIADPGHIFIGWDLAQAEARVVAILARDWELIDAMEGGVDIHVLLASKLPFGLSYEEHQRIIREEYLAKGKSKDEYAPRFLAKRTRHASNYIQSWMGLQQQINKDFLDTNIGVDAKTAKILSNGFLASSPGLEVWWELVLRQVNDDRFITNDFGRRRNNYDWVKERSHEHKDFVAFRPQSDIADLTTLSIADVDKTPWVQVFAHMHDGGLLQVPEEMKDDAIALVQRAMVREFRVEKELLTVPVDVKVGRDWKNLTYVK